MEAKVIQARLNSVANVLETVETKGSANMRNMLACIEFLRELGNEVVQPEQQSEPTIDLGELDVSKDV